MSKSLEALERLCKVKIYQKEASAYDYLGKEIYKEEINLIKQDLVRKEELEKENQELKDKNTKMFVELSNTITAINKFLNYLDKDKTKTIAKYSIKETFFKIIDKVVEE
jgi:hypothetical protein